MQSTIRALAGGALLFLAGPAGAQNLLTNPGFATDLSGWSTNGLNAVWQAVDATGQSNSGSASVTVSAPGESMGISQCVPVTAGQQYDFGARVEVPAGQNGQNGEPVFGNMTIVWASGAGCTGSRVGNELETPSIQTDFFFGTSMSQTAPAGAASATVLLIVQDPPGLGSATAYFDDAYFQPSGGCTPEATNLCMNSGRFKVSASFSVDGATGPGQAQAVSLTDDTGFLWFFAATNVEVVVKVLNGCGLGGHYWVFAGGLTNVNVVMTVTDTLKNVSKSYTNPSDTPFQPLQDTAAFSTCP
jgi:hypothetical protein